MDREMCFRVIKLFTIKNRLRKSINIQNCTRKFISMVRVKPGSNIRRKLAKLVYMGGKTTGTQTQKKKNTNGT